MKTHPRLLQTAWVISLLTYWVANAHAQLTWATNNGTITITGGCPTSPGAVVIPETINGLPVTAIGASAFRGCTNMTSITLPNSVTSIGTWAFYWCTGLTSVSLPEGVISIESNAFMACSRLTDVAIPNSVTSISSYAFANCASLSKIKLSESQKDIVPATFYNCSSLKTVVIPARVASIRKGATIHDLTPGAFAGCPLATLYFEGNTPILQGGPGVFTSTNMTVYYCSGTTGWGATFAGRPTEPWVRPEPVILKTPPGVALQTNGFGFRISWATNSPVVVEATASLSTPEWSPVSTNTLVNGWVDFRDSDGAAHDECFYRVRKP